MQEIKPEQIDSIIKENQFKYVELRGTDGRKYGGYNQRPTDLSKKIDSVKKFCKSVPDGLYYLNFKINPNGDPFTYLFKKGNVNLSESVNNPMPSIIQLPPVGQLEKFQTLEEWKRQENKIKELEAEISQLKLEAMYNKQITELSQPEPENPILGFAQNILPLFQPVVEQYMNLKEREISLKERQNTNDQPQTSKTTKVVRKHPFRPIPGVDSIDFDKYVGFLDGLNDIELTRELVYVQQNKPEVYEWLQNNYLEPI